jgi:hypothetical protein
MNPLYFGIVQQGGAPIPIARPSTAMQLDVIGNQLLAVNSISSVGVPSTLAAWVWFPITVSVVDLNFNAISLNNNVSCNSDNFSIYKNKQGITSFRGGDTRVVSLSSPPSFSNGFWYFIIGIHSATNNRRIRAYRGTTLFHTVTSTQPSSGSASGAPVIFDSSCTSTNPATTEVKINSVGIWNGVAFTDTQANTLFNGGDGLSYSNLAGAGLPAPTAYWDCNDLNTLVAGGVQDKTGNGYDLFGDTTKFSLQPI